MIFNNVIFQYADSGERLRVIYEDEKYVYYVELDKDTSMPKQVEIEKIQSEIENNILVKISDMFLVNVDEQSIPNTHKVKRNKEWEYVRCIWPTEAETLIDANKRSRLIREKAIELGIQELKLKRILTKFWQRGMTKNALLPDYKNSGAKGKERELKYDKVGRPKKTDYFGESQDGINATEDVKKIMSIAIDKFYRKKEKPTLKSVYNSMLREFFSDKYVENGEIKYKVWNQDKIPTYHQFYYWYKKHEDIKKDITFRGSSKEFDLNYRPLTGSSVIETDGPGTRFQIDATVADVYLVSSLNRNRIIGRPIIYLIMDVYSRIVTGMYVGLEGPSWVGAMMALDNMIEDKVEFCRKYDIDITAEQWPCNHLPETIIADNGEFEGYSVENLINNLNIKIENTPPYRGDLKGIVERKFRTVNEKIKHKTPGAIQKEFRARGDRDYRLDATLNLEEFTQIMVKLVLHHNHKIITNYSMDKEMISDELSPTPLNLWNWGIRNKKGGLKIVDRDIMRLNILPTGKASISRAGLKFKKLFYSSQKAIEEQWFVQSKQRWIDIVYDPRNMNYIYILHEDGKGYEVCHLLEKSHQYKDCRLEEIIFQEELKEELIELEKDKQNQFNVALDNEIDDIVKRAEREKKKGILETTSKNNRLKGIKANRKLEKALNRQKEAFELGIEEKEGIVKSFNHPVKEADKEVKDTRRLSLMEKIKKQRDEKLGK